jgi:hypothetical protein
MLIGCCSFRKHAYHCTPAPRHVSSDQTTGAYMQHVCSQQQQAHTLNTLTPALYRCCMSRRTSSSVMQSVQESTVSHHKLHKPPQLARIASFGADACKDPTAYKAATLQTQNMRRVASSDQQVQVACNPGSTPTMHFAHHNRHAVTQARP